MQSNSGAPPIYMQGFDPLRVISAFAVVYMHGSISNSTLANLSDWTVFAVPSFFLIAGFLAARSLEGQERPSFLQYSVKRLLRLLPAYLTWSVLYLGMRAFKLIILDGSGWQNIVSVNWATWLLLGGYTYHLWFVPTLFYFLCILYFILKCTLFLSNVVRIAALLGLSAFAFLLYAYVVNMVEPIPSVANYLTRYALKNIGFIFLGAVFLLVVRGDARWQPAVTLVAVAAGLGVLLLGAFSWSFETDTLWVLTISIAMFASAALVQKGGGSALVAKLSTVSFGIYLVHAAFLEAFRVALGVMLVPMTAAVTGGLILAAFIASAVFALHVARYGRLKWLVR